MILGWVVDVSGFPKRSRMFAGNVSEATTLQKMLADLGALPGATVVMDAGIATEANLVWLKLHGHPYVVVSRKQARQFDCDQVIEGHTAGQQAIQVQRVQAPGSGEVMLYCHKGYPLSSTCGRISECRTTSSKLHQIIPPIGANF